MKGQEVFAKLKQAFEEAVEYSAVYGMGAGGIEISEIRRSGLLQEKV